ncbi:MAG: adenylyltransferase/cytidyltransferase family protein [Patescibacteria group bacterium]|nr:adenylyltransferase/cytidyltransferase family protein [Patescibacteria group bacterium]
MTTVLVTGCFDVLHQEHKKFLKAAKKQGDILLVGLETDDRIRKLKNRDHPCNLLNTRIKNLKKWGIADKIFSLPEKFDLPKHHRALINQIKPDILAVSSHTPNLPTKRHLMRSIGGIIKVVLPHNPKISTTKIIQGSEP